MWSSFIRHSSSLALVGALAGAMCSAPAWSQIASDPTRPPEGFVTEDPGAGDFSGPVLQSVMLSPTRKAAIISGRMVQLGEKYGDAVLVKVAESEVVLKSGEMTQVLKLHPGVEKREIAPAAPKPAPRGPKAVQDRVEPAAAESASPR